MWGIAIVGLMVGAIVFQNFGGAIVGFIIGILLSRTSTQASKLKLLESAVAELQATFAAKDGVLPQFAAIKEKAEGEAPKLAEVMDRFQSGDSVPEDMEQSISPVAVASDEVPLAQAIRAQQERAKDENSPKGLHAPRSEERSAWESIVEIYQYLFGNKNPIVVTGIGMLFLGVAFFLSYAVQSGLLSFPIEYRLVAIGIFGIGLFCGGYRSFAKRPDFGAALQGGGVGIVYLTTLFAYRSYALISPTLCLSILFTAILFAAVFASIQNAPALAMLGLLGGFAAPIAASSGSGNITALLLFYLFLNLGVLFLSLTHRWSNLLQVAFVLTEIALFGATISHNSAHHQVSIVLLSAILTALYIAAPIGELSLKSRRLSDFTRMGLAWGAPILGYGVIAVAVRNQPYAAGQVAILFGACATALWYGLRRFCAEAELSQAFSLLALIFGGVAIPELFNAVTTVSLWAIYGAIVAILGESRGLKVPKVIGRVVVISAIVLFFSQLGVRSTLAHPFNTTLVGGLVLWIVCEVLAYKTKSQNSAMLVFGPWVGAGIAVITLHWECERYLGQEAIGPTMMIGVAAIAYLQHLAGRHLRRPLGDPARVLPYALVLMNLWILMTNTLLHSGWYALLASVFTLALAAMMYLDLALREKLYPYLEHAALFLVVHLIIWQRRPELFIPTGDLAFSLPLLLSAIVVVVFFVSNHRWRIENRDRYLLLTQAIPTAIIFCGVLHGIQYPVVAWENLYVPLINIVEITALVCCFALNEFVSSWQRFAKVSIRRPAFIISVFLAIAVVLARGVHHYAGVSYELTQLLRSSTFHSALSITWASISLLIVVIATRRGQRPLWFTGVAVLGAVIVKMFLIDLAQIGTLARVGSFIVVGGLMLLIGFISPLPPSTENPNE